METKPPTDGAEANVVSFSRFEADLDSGQLRKNGTRIRLRPQCFQVLIWLIEHAGQVVTREELRRKLWPDEVFVDFEKSLNTAVAQLREVLGDSAEHPRFIETLPRRGYRFIAEVRTRPPATAGQELRRARLIALPFVNLSGDPAQEYLNDGLTDELITLLANLSPKRLAVIARTTAMHYKGSHKDVAAIDRELGVDYVVEGALHHAGEQIAINVQLIRTSDQAHVFARRYEADRGDMFHMLNSLAQDLAVYIDAPGVAAKIREGSSQTQRRRKPTEHPGAYNEYIQGQYLIQRGTAEAIAGARQHFDQAIKRDPEFALAHIALADLYSWLGYGGYMRPRDAFSIGITYAMRAVEIDDTLAEAHVVLAEYHKQLCYNWPAARREMARALELNPSSPFVRCRHAVVTLMPHNRMDEAVAQIEGSLESDPLSGFARTWLGVIQLLRRDYEQAIREAHALQDLEPASCWPHFVIGAAYRQQYVDAVTVGHSRPDLAAEAVSEHMKAYELAPRTDFLLGWLGLALGVCGRKDEARAVLEQLQQCGHYTLPTNFAHVYLGLGEIDAAFEWLDRAVEESDQLIMPILSYAHYDPIRLDPRFAALLYKMNLN
jgi:TolB-like protein/Flp pilus assembly protein TadD